MSLYTLTKKFTQVGNMLNAFSITLFYKMVWWFDGQNIGVKQRKPRFNPFTNIYYVQYVYSYMYLIHVCKCIISRWVVNR
jgi:hypothetical protein